MRFILIFIFLSVLMTILLNIMGIEFYQLNYWHKHGISLLLGLSFFPRLALLLSSIPSGGIFWWLGLIFCPRYLIALLATIYYWQTNPILVCFAWLIATGGETSEKTVLRKVYVQKVRKNSYDQMDVIEAQARTITD